MRNVVRWQVGGGKDWNGCRGKGAERTACFLEREEDSGIYRLNQ